VHQGAVVADLDPGRAAPRTFVAHDTHGHWALGMTGYCSLAELGAVLRHAEVTSVLDIQEALNLDGGPSSGLWLHSSAGTIYRREGSRVRNYLGLMPRSSAAGTETTKVPDKTK
jgi:hypothetical protein